MTEAPVIIPQNGKIGMTVDDLIFHKHELSYGADILEDAIKETSEDSEKTLKAALKGMPDSIQETMLAWSRTLRSTKHAVVIFDNGAYVSVITGVPEDRHPESHGIMMFAKADERVPTYEIAYTSPDGQETILPYQTADEISEILSRMASLPPLNKKIN